MLERLVYRSRSAHKLGSLHLFNLLVQCREGMNQAAERCAEARGPVQPGA